MKIDLGRTILIKISEKISSQFAAIKLGNHVGQCQRVTSPKNVPVNVERIKFAELKRSAIHFKMQPGRIPAGAGLHPTVHHGLGRFLESVRFKCPGGSRPYGRCHSNRIQAPHCVGEIQPLGSNIETKCLQSRTALGTTQHSVRGVQHAVGQRQSRCQTVDLLRPESEVRRRHGCPKPSQLPLAPSPPDLPLDDRRPVKFKILNPLILLLSFQSRLDRVRIDRAVKVEMKILSLGVGAHRDSHLPIGPPGHHVR